MSTLHPLERIICHTDIVRLLLEHNADPNIQSNNGNTSLILASLEGHTDIVRLLLEHNADPNIQNKFGKKAFEVTQNSNIKVLIENQVRFNRKKAFMIMLRENGYIQSSSSLLITVAHLRFSNIFSNERLYCD